MGRERMETGGDEQVQTPERKQRAGRRPAVHTRSLCPWRRDVYFSTASVSSSVNGHSNTTCQGIDKNKTRWHWWFILNFLRILHIVFHSDYTNLHTTTMHMPCYAMLSHFSGV